jgi:hypothetical protein
MSTPSHEAAKANAGAASNTVFLQYPQALRSSRKVCTNIVERLLPNRAPLLLLSVGRQGSARDAGIERSIAMQYDIAICLMNGGGLNLADQLMPPAKHITAGARLLNMTISTQRFTPTARLGQQHLHRA